MTIIELAHTVLKGSKKELHFRDIAQQAMVIDNERILGTDLESAAKKIGSALAAHTTKNNKKPSAIFKRVPNGIGGFKAGVYTLMRRVAPPPPRPVIDTENPMPTTFTGKAGEYGVFSELLYWGYNPAMMVVDHGVDIIAAKNGEYFHIQVKTSNPNTNGGFNFKITRAIFEANDNSKTFYVFVVRRVVNKRQLSDYVIMPSSMIRYLLSSNLISSSKDVSFTITIEDGHFKVNGKHQLTDVNDFSLIR